MITSGFFNSSNHDRVYNAEQFGALFDGIINDGILMGVGNHFETNAATGMSVNVASGRAWFNSTWIYNDAIEIMTLDNAHLIYDRIDAIVIEVDRTMAVRNATIKIVKGEESSSPVKPTLINTADVHQHAIAYVTVKASVTEIKQSDIEIVVGTDECPIANAILETVSASALLLQWGAQFNDFMSKNGVTFNDWFQNLRNQLDTNQAAHLQNEIDTLTDKIETRTGEFVEGILPIGEGVCVIESDLIQTDKMFDIYTNVYGVSPKEVKVETGKMTLTFLIQREEIGIKVRCF